MTWVPVACTLPSEQVPLQAAEFNGLVARALQTLRRPKPTRLRLCLTDATQIKATGTDLVAREDSCCSLYGVTRTHDQGDPLWAEVRVPPGRETVLDGLAHQASAAAPRAEA